MIIMINGGTVVQRVTLLPHSFRFPDIIRNLWSFSCFTQAYMRFFFSISSGADIFSGDITKAGISLYLLLLLIHSF